MSGRPRVARILGFLIVLCFLSAPAFAQNLTTVTATITDPNGLPYSFATIQAQLIPTGITPTINGQGVAGFTRASADVNGTFSMNLASNAVLSPAGTQWQFTVNTSGITPPAGTGPQGFSFISTGTLISGASVNISAQLSGAAPALSRIVSAFGPQGISPLAPPYNMTWDAATVIDGSIANGSFNLTSATAHWQTNAKVGQRIWGAEPVGGNIGRLAFMGTISSITSDTVVVLSQSSNCNTSNPCTGLKVEWGTGGQNTQFQAWASAIANTTNPKATCGILPTGGFVWEAAVNKPGVQVGVCLQGSTQRSTLFPTPDFAFVPGGQISFANSSIDPYFALSDIEIDGGAVTTTDGRTPVFQGIGGGAEAFFVSQANARNLYVHDWGAGVAGWNCMVLDNYQWSYNLHCTDAGESQTQGSVVGFPVHIIGGLFSNRASGNAALNITTPTATSHVSFGSNGAAATWRGVKVVSATNWTSVNDHFVPAAFEDVWCQASGSRCTLIGDTLIGQTGRSVILSGTGNTVTVSESIVTAAGGQKAFDTSGGGLIFDLYGNKVTGISDAQCTSAGGTCGSAQEGSVTIAAAATTVTVTTTAVTANSKFSITENATLGTALSVTCNTATNIGLPFVSAITPGTSYVITVPTAPVTNPACLQWKILNPGA